MCTRLLKYLKVQASNVRQIAASETNIEYCYAKERQKECLLCRKKGLITINYSRKVHQWHSISR